VIINGSRVDLSVRDPAMAEVGPVISEVVKEVLGFNRVVRTSAYRPRLYGAKFSFHNVGQADDYDVAGEISEDKGGLVANKVRVALGPQFECIWHKTDGGAFHWHVEFDPKK